MRQRLDRPRRKSVLLVDSISPKVRCGRRAGTSDRSRSRCVPRGGQTSVPWTRPRTVLDCPSGKASTAPRRNARARCSGVVAPRVCSFSSTRRHGGGEILVRPGPARREDAGRAAQRIDRKPESRRAPAGRRRARRRGLERRVLREGVPVSSGSARPSSPAETTATPRGRRAARDLAELAGIVVATTSLAA